MSETPGWLQFLESSPAGAETAGQAENPTNAATFLTNYHAGLQKIRTAWEKGNIVNQYLFTVFPDIYDLLRFAMATDKTDRLIYRQRTAAEAYQDFPQPPNPDGTINFPVAVSAEWQPQPLVFDLTANSGPTIIIADQHQLDDFLDTISQSAILANRPNFLKIFKDNSNITFLADQVCQRLIPSKPKNIVIASLSPETSTDTLINLGWISRMCSPAFHLILAIKSTDSTAVTTNFRQANNRIEVLPPIPTTFTFSEAPYFTKTDAINPQGQKYFPLAPSR